MKRTITRRRFLAASVASCAAPGLFRSVRAEAAKEVEWLAEVQRPPPKLPDDPPRLSPLLARPDGGRIESLEAWRERRSALRAWWLDFLGPLAKQERPRPPDIRVLEEDRPEGAIRQRVEYEVEPGERVEAYILKPDRPSGRLPGAVALHSTVEHSIRQPAGVEGRREKAFGLELARRGVVSICPRNFLWPENRKISGAAETERFQKRHPGSKGMAKMLFDAQVATDILAGLPEVDPERLGAVGHSLGAKEVLYLAAFDERIRVAVSSEGGIGTTFSNWDAPWYLGEAIHGREVRDAGHEHHEVLALVAPRAFLLIGGDSADGARSWPFIAAALPVWKLHDGPPRVGLYNHGKGHSVPPEAERRIYEWFETYPAAGGL